MNCPKCTTPAAAGATHCKRCGTPLSAKAAAPAATEEYDLMPMEEAKPAFSAYEPPPGLDLGPPPPAAAGAKGGAKAAPGGPPGAPGADYVPKIRGAMASPPQNKLTRIIGAAVAVVGLIVVAYFVFRTKSEMVFGKPKTEQLILLQPGKVFPADVEATGVMSYAFDVEMLDGEMLVGMVQRSRKDPKTLADLKKCEPLKTLRKGEKESFTGELKHKEQWSWMLLNDSKKPARAKVKFLAEPR